MSLVPRPFAGRHFVTIYQNGIRALAEATVHDHLEALSKQVEFLVRKGFETAANALYLEFATSVGPIYTFVDLSVLRQTPGVFSGTLRTYETIREYILMGGGSVTEELLFVPFEKVIGSTRALHELEPSELIWRTSPDALIEFFPEPRWGNHVSD